MTGAQASYLETLCREAGEGFDPKLTKAEASKRIEELQANRARSGSLRPGQGRGFGCTQLARWKPELSLSAGLIHARTLAMNGIDRSLLWTLIIVIGLTALWFVVSPQGTRTALLSATDIDNDVIPHTATDHRCE
jgi:hypothetical protein